MEDLSVNPKFNPDTDVMIRGYPRDKMAVDFVQQFYGAKLLPDTELDLMLKLDTALGRIRMKLAQEAKAKGEKAKYPEFLQLPGDDSRLYIPVPFNIKVFNLTLQSFHKPAWFVCPRYKVVGGFNGNSNSKSI